MSWLRFLTDKNGWANKNDCGSYHSATSARPTRQDASMVYPPAAPSSVASRATNTAFAAYLFVAINQLCARGQPLRAFYTVIPSEADWKSWCQKTCLDETKLF